MRLISKVEPPYLPETDQESVLRLALQPLAMPDWLQVDADFAAFNAHKNVTLNSHPALSCIAAPRSEPAQLRFGQFLLRVLSTHNDFSIDAGAHELQHIPSGLKWSINNPLLAQSSCWIQEDICLLEPEDCHYVLQAASVCSPSNWKLEEKLGRSLDAIHEPVPGYAQQLGQRVNRLLFGLKPGKAFLRYNWSLQPDNELFWRPDRHTNANSEAVFWRVERQSLFKLPESDTVVFSIRIYLHSLATLARCGQSLANLQAILARLPADQQTYKGLTVQTIRNGLKHALQHADS